MAWIGAIVGVALIGTVLIDAFEVVLLPRRVRHGYRLARIFYRESWRLGRSLAGLLPAGRWRQGSLAAFGPLSLFGLIVVWAMGLITGFALLLWSSDTDITGTSGRFTNYFYYSATTFFTLGTGDMIPSDTAARAMSVIEAGTGFIFLAVIISYLPVLYQAFSRREITISMLDARAGSPPTAGELLRRLADGGGSPQAFLIEWERWAAELLESHISFPMLSFYRSQHENQSWVGTLTAILDTSALLMTSADGTNRYQAKLTFATARHAAVDLALIFGATPLPPEPDRLPEADFIRLVESLRGASMPMRDGPAVAKALAEVRLLYEPFANALSAYFQFALPAFLPTKPPVDNWQTSPWMPRSPAFGSLPGAAADDHFDG